MTSRATAVLLLYCRIDAAAVPAAVAASTGTQHRHSDYDPLGREIERERTPCGVRFYNASTKDGYLCAATFLRVKPPVGLYDPVLQGSNASASSC